MLAIAFHFSSPRKTILRCITWTKQVIGKTVDVAQQFWKRNDAFSLSIGECNVSLREGIQACGGALFKGGGTMKQMN